MKVKRWSKVNIIRAAIQILFILLVPALFSIGFGGIKALASAVRSGELSMISVAIKTAFLLLLFTAVFGRFFCGWICAFGAYTDFVYALAQRFKKKTGRKISFDRKLKWMKYIILVVILFLYVFGMRALLKGTSPWDVFGQLISLRPRLNGYSIGIIALILVTIGSAFIERFYCRYLCAFGACFAMAARIKILMIKKPKDSCAAGCKMCTARCPMGISLYERDVIPGAECIKCLRCIEVCRKDNAKIMLGKVPIQGWVYVAVMTILFLMLLFYLGLIKLG